jgi:hypothetical protein
MYETCKNLLFATFHFAPSHVCNNQNLWLNEGKESIFLSFVVWFEWEMHFANLKVLVNENLFNVFHVFIAIIEGFNISLVFHFLFGSLCANHSQTSSLSIFFKHIKVL